MPTQGKARNLDEWCEMYLDTRSDLHDRKIRGEKLNKMEDALLKSLNEDLEELTPTNEGLPPEILAIVAKVLKDK